VVPAFFPGGVGGQRCLDALEKDEVVPGAFRRAAERGEHIHHVRMERASVERLQRAHRPADHQANVLDTKLLGDEPVLGANVVIGGDQREPQAIVWFGHVAARRRQAVAEHIRDDDEILGWIERHAGADQPFVVIMLARIPGRVDDDVVLGGIQFAKLLVGKLAVPDRRSALQGDVT
jgi:hypothetical protein